MASSSVNLNDNSSDYGSEFSPEEELILNQLLASAGTCCDQQQPAVRVSEALETFTPISEIYSQPRNVSAADSSTTRQTGLQENQPPRSVQVRGHDLGVIRCMKI